MNYTAHALLRMNQRNIPKELVSIALNFGHLIPGTTDRIIFNQKDLNEIRNSDTLLWQKLKIGRYENRPPIVCVVKDENIITVFY